MSPPISGRLVARNTAGNLLGEGLPLLVGVVAVPFLVRALGTERFGVLLFQLAILGYFSIFDLGLGRGATRLVAAALGRGRPEEVPAIVWTAAIPQAAVGLSLAALFLWGNPALVEAYLRVPGRLQEEVAASFAWLALGIPPVMLFTTLRGALEAAQRVDRINRIRIPLKLSNFLIPLPLALAGLGLAEIVAGLVLARLLTLAGYLAQCAREYPGMLRPRFAVGPLGELVSYGKWLIAAGILSPILMFMDQFLIGRLLDLPSLTYYSVPKEFVSRLWLLPMSLASVLFPAFAAVGGRDPDRLRDTFRDSLQYLMLFLGPVIFVLVAFGGDILHLWLGREFAVRSALPLRLLALGVLAISIGRVPHALVLAVGRSDVIPRFFALELLVAAPLMFMAIERAGIAGAAAVWAGRGLLDTVLLLAFCLRRPGLRAGLAGRGAGHLAVWTAALGAAWLAGFLHRPELRLAAGGAILAAALAAVWWWLFGEVDRRRLTDLIRSRGRRPRGGEG